MKKIIIVVFLTSLFINSIKGQDENVQIGLSYPAYGVKIKANFPSYNGGWARGFSIANEDNSQNYLGLGVMGICNNGVTSMSYGWIGRDYNNSYLSFTPNGNVGIGTTNPGSKLVIAEGTNGVSINSGNVSGLGFNRNVSDGAIYNPNLSAWQFSARDERFSLEGYNGADHNLLNVLKNGNVGIGTISPITKLDVEGKLHVASDIYGSKVLTFQDDARFEVSSTTIPSLSNNSFSMPQYGIATPNTTGAADLWLAGYNAIRMFTAGNVNPVVNILNSGNVGIGTQNPAYKLDVLGTIRAKEVLVNLDGGADFVFEKGYKLPTIEHVATYVQENKHLPDIPSANEMTKNGVSMGDMQVKLLQKVEELTLYAIQQNKEIVEQRTDRRILEEKLSRQENQYNALLERVEMLTKQLEKK